MGHLGSRKLYIHIYIYTVYTFKYTYVLNYVSLVYEFTPPPRTFGSCENGVELHGKDFKDLFPLYIYIYILGCF